MNQNISFSLALLSAFAFAYFFNQGQLGLGIYTKLGLTHFVGLAILSYFGFQFLLKQLTEHRKKKIEASLFIHRSTLFLVANMGAFLFPVFVFLLFAFLFPSKDSAHVSGETTGAMLLLESYYVYGSLLCVSLTLYFLRRRI